MSEIEVQKMQELTKEITTAIPNVTTVTGDGKLYLGLRVFILKGETEQEKIADINDHLKYVAIGLKWVVGEAPKLNKIEFLRKAMHETRQKETIMRFQRAQCTCCEDHTEPHTFSLITPMETKPEDIELELMMTAFKHLLDE